MEHVYYTPYPEAHQDWLAVIRVKVHSAINNNVISQPEIEAPYQDVHEVDGIQIMLQIDSDEYQEILAMSGLTTRYLTQSWRLCMTAESEKIYVSTDDEESEGEFSDRDSS